MRSDLKDARIIIADDQQSNIEVLREFLLMQGYENLYEFSDSREIIPKVKEIKPDLLLLDLMMPHLTGFQVMDLLKSENLQSEYMPILVLTADVTQEAKLKALKGGANDFLTKPFDLVEVGLRIKNLLFSVYLLSRLKEQNLLLEDKVRERTRELEITNEELTIAKNKADEMNKLKSFFLANVSHEFRTPLVSILGFSELLMLDVKDPEILGQVKYINGSAQRLQRTLNDILALVDIEKRKIEANLRRTEIVNLIQGLLPGYKRRADISGLTLTHKIPESEVFLLTDFDLLKTVVDNIVDNALKFTTKGSISFSVEIEEEGTYPCAFIRVADTGKGISQEQIEKIFLPFRQVSEGLNRSHEGLGIGLTVAKQLVDVLRGEISVESSEGKGSVFTIKLPIVQSETELKARIHSARRSVTREFSDEDPKKPDILLVEDNEGNRMIFKKILSENFRVTEAADGVKAIALAELKRYDMILMDINLGPGINGIETFKRIHIMPGYQDVPVVAVTAFGTREDEKAFLDHGFAGYIQKPVLKDEFVRIIRNFFQN
ncbi:MAG: response regulator [Ignavibacteriaceae bacterium]|nr:response regulator [Ignavibacteriaceae bacterium]